jgi:hypothetical protein
MITAMTIENFRGFKKLTASGLVRFNLIVGRNSAGKTSFLEAVFAAGLPEPASTMPMLDRARGLPLSGTSHDIRAVFGHWLQDSALPLRLEKVTATGAVETTGTFRFVLDGAAEVKPPAPGADELSSISSDGLTELSWEVRRDDAVISTATVRATQSGLDSRFTLRDERAPSRQMFVFTQATFSAQSLEQLSVLKQQGRVKPIVAALAAMQPELEDVEILVDAGRMLPAGRLADGTLRPLALMGEGLTRCMLLLLAVEQAAGGTLCIDELERGIHVEAQTQVIRALGRAAVARDVQIFATTHSYECVAAAHDAFAETPDDFALIRLERADDGQIAARRYTNKAVEGALKFDMEVR